MIDSARRTPQPERPTVPAEYSGKWVLWSQDGMRIVASGETIEDAERAARQAGESDCIYEWIPPADAGLLGAAGCDFRI